MVSNTVSNGQNSDSLSDDALADRYSLTISDDYFYSEKVVKHGVKRFAVTAEYLLVTYRDQQAPFATRMAVSTINSQSLHLSVIDLPAGVIADNDFTLVDGRHSHLAMHVAKRGSAFRHGTVIVGNSRSTEFRASIDLNVKNDFGYCDFDVVEELPYIYIANVYEADSFRLAHFHRSSMNQQQTGEIDPRALLTKVSRISFDRGTTWNKIGPVINGDCQKKGANKGCSLHLNSLSDYHSGQKFTSATSPGVIVATGNEGLHLDNAKTNTYISEDGGASWRLIIGGDHIYCISDQGGLLVLIPIGLETTTAMFSWDRGRTLQKTTVSSQALFATSVQADKSKVGLVFVVHGVTGGENQLGVVVSLDFSSLMPRACQVEGLADFDFWTPGFNGEEYHLDN